MANINVSYNDMTTAATRLTTGRDDITTKLNELQTLVQNLVSQGFVTDKSSTAFHTSYDQFTTGARNTIQGLDGLADYLRTTAHTLADIDTQLAARLNA